MYNVHCTCSLKKYNDDNEDNRANGDDDGNDDNEDSEDSECSEDNEENEDNEDNKTVRAMRTMRTNRTMRTIRTMMKIIMTRFLRTFQISVWVTGPDRPKGRKDEVRAPRLVIFYLNLYGLLKILEQRKWIGCKSKIYLFILDMPFLMS